MERPISPPELVDYLARARGLTADDARRIVEEVNAYYAEPLEAFVVRRHRELQAEGRLNREIFECIGLEISGRRFPGGALSTRQIRRLIYG